jgi:hypothetical protein
MLIGWKEYLDLPELGIHHLKAKIDTGARTSALHVDDLEVLAVGEDGRRDLLLHLRGAHGEPLTAHAHQLERIRVTDSGGHAEVRPVIETTLRLGRVEKTVRVTLTDRSGMLFPMIIGRKALEGDFVVDVARKYLQGHPSDGGRGRP